MKNDPELAKFLTNPVISAEKRNKVLDTVAKEVGFQQITLNFLKLLVDRNRIDGIDGICEQFEQRYCELSDTQVRFLNTLICRGSVPSS